MKKVCKVLPVIFMAGAMAALVSCGSQKNEEADVSTAYARVIEKEIRLYEKTQKVLSYYVDEKFDSRSVSDDYLRELGESLPSDLSTLKRTVKTTSRGVESEEELNLQYELDEIADEYVSNINENIPDISKLEDIEGIYVNNGVLYLSNGQVVQLNTPEGIAMAEYLISVEETGSGDAYMEKVEKDAETLRELIDSEDESRGMYFATTICGYGQRWPNGLIYYRWGSSITDVHKSVINKAMKEWSEKTDNEVRFEELEDNSWNNFLLAIGNLHVVTYETKSIKDEGWAGLTFPLGMGYFGQMMLDDQNVEDNDSGLGTALHELGHVLGLNHEHQRWDRDNYISVGAVDVTWEDFISDMTKKCNYAVIPHYLGGLVWKIQSYRIGWFTIYIPVLVWDNEATLLTSGADEFDFNSIMLYYGFSLRDQTCTDESKYTYGKDNITKKFGKVTKCNHSLSEKDIETVKNMY